jgi:arylsulfatase A-like enzyme
MKNLLSTIILLLLIIIGSAACKERSEKQAVRPNILFIMSDDHTSQAWGIYGGILEDLVHNPNIERLAENGVVLDNCFCTNSICVPSRATIMTGQYSHKNGVYTLGGRLEKDSLNVAKILQTNGYQTAIFGKWHLKKEPAGFDKYMVLPDQGLYKDPILKTVDNWEDSNKGGKQYKGFSTDVIADFSIEWLKSINPEQAFFLMCHFKATHEPFDYPDRHKDLYQNIEIPYPESLFDEGPETTGRLFKGQTLENLSMRYTKASNGPWWCEYPDLPFSVEGLDRDEARKKTYQKFVKDFMRCGAAIDDNIGKLLDYLEATGQADNTVVIYTADQGYFLGEHGFFDKRMIYEESLRMPFVISYPNEIKENRRIDDIVLNIDFPSLFLDYAGIEQPGSMQGSSFRANLTGNTPSEWRENMYYRYWTNQEFRPAHFGIRNHRYKLAMFYAQARGKEEIADMPFERGWEFYDLEKDPKELHNAIADPQYQEIIKKMKVDLLQQRQLVDDTDEDNPLIKKIIEDNWG